MGDAGEGQGRAWGREKGGGEDKEGKGRGEEEKKRLLSSVCHYLKLVSKAGSKILKITRKF